MRGRKLVWLGGIALGLAAMAASTLVALAEDPTTPAASAAPAARAVRLSEVDGQVKLSAGNPGTASDALANTPLFEGSQLTTADDGRVEIQFEDGSAARLSPNSSLTISQLKMNGATPQTEIVLNSGLAYFEFAGSGTLRIRFGDAIVTPTGNSILRLNLDTPPGTLAVFSGNAHLERGTTVAIDLHGGESVTLNGGEPSKYDLAETIVPDSWDGWNTDRDQALSAEAAASTGAAANLGDNSAGGPAGMPPDQDAGDQVASNDASPEMAAGTPAWNDLDANGSWYNVPGEGYIWSPYAASGAGWDPYGCGHWAWTPRFGYVWVSCFNWGYLPYQFGAWRYYNGFGWGWAPGHRHHPWWNGGVWVSNIGFGPPGYRLPLRPRGIAAPGRVGPVPAIPYNRLAGATTTGLPARGRGAPIAIGGQTVMALRPISSRPQYGGPVAHSFSQPRSGYVGGGATVWPAHMGGMGDGSTFGTNSGSGYGPPSTGMHSSAPPPQGYRPSGGVSAPRSYPAPRSAPASHPAPSGGGGHASSGGGHAAGGSHR